MVLKQRLSAAAAHNSMLGFLIRKPKAHAKDDGTGFDRPAKRQRVADPVGIPLKLSNVMTKSDKVDSSQKASKVERNAHGAPGKGHQQRRQLGKAVASLLNGEEVVGEGDGDDGFDERAGGEGEEERRICATDLESAMPAFTGDEESALKEYEAFRASQEDNAGASGVREPGSVIEAATGELLSNGSEGEKTKRKGNQWIKGRSSIYVDAFKLALETVLDEEAHLFDKRENAIFTAWKYLSYEAQYLYVRLFLRKTAAWHRISGLGYNGDIANLESAIKELQIDRELPKAVPESQEPIPYLEPLDDKTTQESSFTFADTSSGAITSLEEASSLLKLGELRTFAKDAKVRGKNKAELLKALRRTSKRQSGLGWASLKRSDTESSAGGGREGRGDASETESVAVTEDTAESPAELDSPGTNRDAHLVRQMLAETGPCVRLSLPVLKLFERVHLVFYRSTEWTEKSLTAIILSQMSRWNFPSYIVSRSANVFPSRTALREFEAALRAQGRVDNILEFSGRPTPAGLNEILDIFEAVLPRWRVLLCEEQLRENSVYVSGEGAYLRRLSPSWVYTRIIHKATSILGKRKQFLREHAILTELLDQDLFHTSRRGAWYIRKALLEEHYMAKETLTSGSQPNSAQIRDWKKTSLETCETGLQDPLVHLIYHHDLQKRIAKLERALCVPKRQQHSFAHVRLAKATETTVHGIRLEALPTVTPPSLPHPPRRQTSQPSTANNITTVAATTPTTTTAAAAAANTDDTRPKAINTISTISNSSSSNSSRTIWLDPRDNSSRCTVEEMVLTHYRLRGWSGFHSESGIVRTLFALLLFDEIFTYIPHVFQTAFQTAPLDLLHSDSFYAARRPTLEAALADIANGGAAARIRSVWAAHAHRRTCVVGLDWSAFALEQLVDVVECAGGPALAVVCKVLAQEYAQRAGGVPDLLLWRREPGLGPGARQEQWMNRGASDGDCAGSDGRGSGAGSGHMHGEIRFVEVKSENDRLSDTQRLWIDVLTGAGVAVELCHAVAEEVRVLE